MLLEIGQVGIYKFQLLNSGHFLMNRKGAILIKKFIERSFRVRIYGSQCSLVNAIDIIIGCPRMMHPY